jgi:hypothetical protein
MKRLKELREQIEKRVQEKTIDQVYEDVFGMLGSMLKQKSENEIIKTFDEQLVKTGKFPKKFLEGLKFISKTRNEFDKDRKESKSKGKKDKPKVDETRDVENSRKLSAEIVNALIEYNQRCDFLSMDRSRFLLKIKGEVKAELLFLQDTFIIQGPQISKITKGDKLCVSDAEELRKQLAEHQGKEVAIKQDVLANLKKIFGDFELSY